MNPATSAGTGSRDGHTPHPEKQRKFSHPTKILNYEINIIYFFLVLVSKVVIGNILDLGHVLHRLQHRFGSDS